MNKLNGIIEKREDISPARLDAMHSLLQNYFKGVTKEDFKRDLEEKNWVVTIEDALGRIQGFSTLLMYETTWKGEPIGVVASGDTIMDMETRGTSAFARTWLTAISTINRKFHLGKLYWLYICSGYRTYRFLPVFCEIFYPNFHSATPPEIHGLMDHLARERWGDFFIREKGIVRFPCPQILRNGISPVTRERLRNPHVEFFVKRNPGYANGDELLCLAELSPENLTRAARRLMSAGEARNDSGLFWKEAI